MNWKVLGLIACLTLSAGLNSCSGSDSTNNQVSPSPSGDAMKKDKAGDAMGKPDDAMKKDKAGDAMGKPGDAMKKDKAGDAMKKESVPATKP